MSGDAKPGQPPPLAVVPDVVDDPLVPPVLVPAAVDPPVLPAAVDGVPGFVQVSETG